VSLDVAWPGLVGPCATPQGMAEHRVDVQGQSSRGLAWRDMVRHRMAWMAGGWSSPGFDSPAPTHDLAGRGASGPGGAGRRRSRRGQAPRGAARLGMEGGWHTPTFESSAPTHGQARRGQARHRTAPQGVARRRMAWLRMAWNGMAGRHRGSSPRHPREVGHGTGSAGPGIARLVSARRRKAGQGMDLPLAGESD
jgi:hypothetical protein